MAVESIVGFTMAIVTFYGAFVNGLKTLYEHQSSFKHLSEDLDNINASVRSAKIRLKGWQKKWMVYESTSKYDEIPQHLFVEFWGTCADDGELRGEPAVRDALKRIRDKCDEVMKALDALTKKPREGKKLRVRRWGFKVKWVIVQKQLVKEGVAMLKDQINELAGNSSEFWRERNRQLGRLRGEPEDEFHIHRFAASHLLLDLSLKTAKTSSELHRVCLQESKQNFAIKLELNFFAFAEGILDQKNEALWTLAGKGYLTFSLLMRYWRDDRHERTSIRHRLEGEETGERALSLREAFKKVFNHEISTSDFTRDNLQFCVSRGRPYIEGDPSRRKSLREIVRTWGTQRTNPIGLMTAASRKGPDSFLAELFRSGFLLLGSSWYTCMCCCNLWGEVDNDLDLLCDFVVSSGHRQDCFFSEEQGQTLQYIRYLERLALVIVEIALCKPLKSVERNGQSDIQSFIFEETGSSGEELLSKAVVLRNVEDVSVGYLAHAVEYCLNWSLTPDEVSKMRPEGFKRALNLYDTFIFKPVFDFCVESERRFR